MATDRLTDDVTDIEDERSQRQALVESLRTAVEALTTCLEAVYAVIEHVDALAVDTPAQRPTPVRPRVSYGGGRSTLVSVPSSEVPPAAAAIPLRERAPSPAGGESPVPPVPDRPSGARPGGGITRTESVASPTAGRESGPDPQPARSDGLAPPREPRPEVSALMAAADMAHRGYTPDEIAERLRLRWGERAAAILRDLLD